MCYSAEVWTDYHRYVDQFNADVDIKEFAKLCLARQSSPKIKISKGMDRAVINLKPEHIKAWLKPKPKGLQAMQDIMDDKRLPFYEHRLAA